MSQVYVTFRRAYGALASQDWDPPTSAIRPPDLHRYALRLPSRADAAASVILNRSTPIEALKATEPEEFFDGDDQVVAS